MKLIPYNDLYIEIMPQCNAHCAWCDTGMRNIGILPQLYSSEPPAPMNPISFAHLIKNLLNNGIIAKNTRIYPYNFGESFKHKNLEMFIFAIEQMNFPYILSTNASVVPDLQGVTCFNNLKYLVFSMPGFSDTLYKRIHGFSFSRIKQNILRILDLFRRTGFSGIAQIAYHRYRFSDGELASAIRFAAKNNITEVKSNLAVPLSIEIATNFLENTLDSKLRARLEADCFTEKLTANALHRPEGFTCTSRRALTITHDCQLVQCSWTSDLLPGNRLGDVREMSLADVYHVREKALQPFCGRCIRSKADYFMTSWPERTIHNTLSVTAKSSNRQDFGRDYPA